MKISARFTDYGLIGGFFWLLQLAIWGFLGFSNIELESCSQGLKSLLDSLPAPSVPSFAALLGALALIAVFTTGLLLDLCGSSLFRGVEVRVFVGFLRRNRRWLERIVDQNRDYIQEDWSTLLDAPPIWSRSAYSVALKGMTFWNPHHRQEYFRVVRKGWGLLKPYTRVESFLLSYVLLTPGAENIELLSTQMSLWNTSRAIAAAMVLGAISAILLATGSANSNDLALFLSYLVLLAVACAVTYSAHARVCSTLFALAYVIAGKTSLPNRGSALE